MNQGSNPPSGQPGGGKGRRRRRGRRGPAAHGAQTHQHGQQQQGQGQGQGQRHGHGHGQGHGQSQGHGQGQHRPGKNRHAGKKHGNPRRHEAQTGGGIYTAPMDHSYRAAQGESDGNSVRQQRGRGQFGKPLPPVDPEPLPATALDANSPAKIFVFVDDLFFVAKIQETSRKMNIKVEFVKTDKELYERMGQNGDKPTLIIFDLNSNSAKPLTTIPKLKSKLKKGTNIIGFVSHVQGDLKMKAQEAGCDMVLPRSAFSQNLAALLRRHAGGDELDEVQ